MIARSTAWFLGLLTAVAMLVGTRTAFAQVIIGPRSGFRGRLDVPAIKVCVLRPPNLHDEKACKALLTDTTLATLAQQKGPEFAVAILVSGSDMMTASFTDTDVPTGSKDSIDQYFEAMKTLAARQGMKVRYYGASPGSTHDIVKIHGLDAMQWSEEVSVEGGAPVVLGGYAFPGAESVVLVLFAPVEGDLEHLRPRIDAILDTVEIGRPFLPLGASRSERLGYATGYLAGYVIIGIVAVVLLIRYLRKRIQGSGPNANPRG